MTGCPPNIDPRTRSETDAVRFADGGWIIVYDHHGYTTQGELISIDRAAVRVLRQVKPAGCTQHITEIPPSEITHATLYHFHAEGPARAELVSVIDEYPGVPLDAMAAWARFPQGWPPGLDPQRLQPPCASP